jgi:glutamyl-tRNA reductase
MVLGEPQILGQLKEAFQRFQNLGWVGGRFNYLFPNAFHTAKRVRTETGISNYAVSISFAAVELAKRIFSDLSQQRVLIIGAGEMAELALQNLKSHGVADVMVTNRTYTNAENLADKFAGTAILFEQLENRLCEADIIISSTGARHFILTQSMVRKCLKKRRARAMFFIDIAVPRDIEPEINDLPGAYCYDIDDLQNVVQKNQEERVRQAEQADKILEDEIARVQDWFLTRSAVPTIRKIRNEFEHISQAELEKTLLRLSHLSDKDRDLVTSLVHRITQKILHKPTINMKALSKEEDRSLQLQVLLDVFSEKEGNNKLLDEKKPNLKLVRGAKS